jgi:hypothetical protein
MDNATVTGLARELHGGRAIDGSAGRIDSTSNRGWKLIIVATDSIALAQNA